MNTGSPAVSVILWVQRDSLCLARSLASLAEAATFARANGSGVELVAVLDQADAATRQVLQNADLSAFTRRHAVDGLGRPRPDMVRDNTMGRYVTLIKGGDLVSYALFARMFDAAERLGPAAVLVPKVCFDFGTRYAVVQQISQDRSQSAAICSGPVLVGPRLCHRSLCIEQSVQALPAGRGGTDDWQFDADAISAGCALHAVDNTAVFLRRRKDVDSSADAIVPVSPLFQPAVFFRAFYAEFLQHAGCAGLPVPPKGGVVVLQDPHYREMIAHANAIDPEIELSEYSSCARQPDPDRSAAGRAYHRVCEVVGEGRFDAAFLLAQEPNPDGAGAVARAIWDLANGESASRFLVLADSDCGSYQDMPDMPGNVVLIDLALLCRGVGARDRDVMCMHLLQSCAEGADLHCAPSGFAHRLLTRFGERLRERAIICYRPADRVRQSYGGCAVDPRNFEFVNAHGQLLDRIVVFDQHTLDADRRRFPGPHRKWQLRQEVVGQTA